jgi:hypothetical protein
MPPEPAFAHDVLPPAPAVRPAAGRARRPGAAPARDAADATSRAARSIDGARANLATLRAAPPGAAPEPLALALLADHLRTARRWVAIARDPALAAELDAVLLAARAYAVEGAARSAPRRGGPPAAHVGGGRAGDELFALLAAPSPAIGADGVGLASDAIDAVNTLDADTAFGLAGEVAGLVGGAMGVGATAAKAADAPNEAATGLQAVTLGIKGAGLAVGAGGLAAGLVGDELAGAALKSIGKGLGRAASVGEAAADLTVMLDGDASDAERFGAGLSAGCNLTAAVHAPAGAACKGVLAVANWAGNGIHDTSRSIVDGLMGDAFLSLARSQRQLGGLDLELRGAGLAVIAAADPVSHAEAIAEERRACDALGGALDALLDECLAQPALGGRSSTPGCYSVLVDRLAPLQRVRGRRAPGPLLEAAALATSALAACLAEQDALAEEEMQRGRRGRPLLDGPQVRAAAGA